ncbi:MAG: pilV [Burkholderiaceae bacterium]|nr:pilV [Burkholderiaceae bacterium]
MHTTKQLGFTLVEVLVSIFVLALGVIGVAGMQVMAMRNSQTSNYQTIAVQLATELADNMRSNAAAMNQDDSSNPFIFDYNAATDSAPTAPAKKCYTTTDCSASELAEFDIYLWKLRLTGQIKDAGGKVVGATGLPGGRVKVCRDKKPYASGSLTWDCTAPLTGGVNSPMVIKVGWQGRGTNPDGSANTDGSYPPSVAITVESYVNPTQ